jgi:rod shape-determining protein MreD
MFYRIRRNRPRYTHNPLEDIFEYIWIGLSLLISFYLTVLPPFFFYPYGQSPDFLMITVMYWSLTTPFHGLVGVIFFVALSKDALMGNVLGSNAIYYLAVSSILRNLHYYIINYSFFILWCILSLVLICVTYFMFLLFQFFDNNYKIGTNFIDGFIATMVFYPFIHFILDIIHQRIVRYLSVKL